LSTLPTEAERAAVLFDPKPNILGERIAQVLREGIVIAGVHETHRKAGETWDQLLTDLAEMPPASATPWTAVVSLDQRTALSLGEAPADPEPPVDADPNPLVSVILVHHNRPSTLTGALDSLIAQTYENLEIIVVDDGSSPGEYRTVTEILERLDDPRIRLIRQENRYLGAARNFGVSHAQGTFVLFMDDDNFAQPTEVEVLTRVAVTSGADVLNTVSRLFRTVGTERVPYDLYLPIGPSLPMALFGNTFGDANALVRREAFTRIGGFTEEYALGCEDYEFFNRAFLSGAKMQFVPELLFDYRADEDSMMKELNSGKYIINQTRGVSPFFDTHRT
ncbi:MAG: glycosyltransferase family A protein, partial [Pseudomonadota bacterium]